MKAWFVYFLLVTVFLGVMGLLEGAGAIGSPWTPTERLLPCPESANGTLEGDSYAAVALLQLEPGDWVMRNCSVDTPLKISPSMVGPSSIHIVSCVFHASVWMEAPSDGVDAAADGDCGVRDFILTASNVTVNVTMPTSRFPLHALAFSLVLSGNSTANSSMIGTSRRSHCARNVTILVVSSTLAVRAASESSMASIAALIMANATQISMVLSNVSVGLYNCSEITATSPLGFATVASIYASDGYSSVTTTEDVSDSNVVVLRHFAAINFVMQGSDVVRMSGAFVFLLSAVLTEGVGRSQERFETINCSFAAQNITHVQLHAITSPSQLPSTAYATLPSGSNRVGVLFLSAACDARNVSIANATFLLAGTRNVETHAAQGSLLMLVVAQSNRTGGSMTVTNVQIEVQYAGSMSATNTAGVVHVLSVICSGAVVSLAQVVVSVRDVDAILVSNASQSLSSALSVVGLGNDASDALRVESSNCHIVVERVGELTVMGTSSVVLSVVGQVGCDLYLTNVSVEVRECGIVESGAMTSWAVSLCMFSSGTLSLNATSINVTNVTSLAVATQHGDVAAMLSVFSSGAALSGTDALLHAAGLQVVNVSSSGNWAALMMVGTMQQGGDVALTGIAAHMTDVTHLTVSSGVSMSAALSLVTASSSRSTAFVDVSLLLLRVQQVQVTSVQYYVVALGMLALASSRQFSCVNFSARADHCGVISAHSPSGGSIHILSVVIGGGVGLLSNVSLYACNVTTLRSEAGGGINAAMLSVLSGDFTTVTYANILAVANDVRALSAASSDGLVSVLTVFHQGYRQNATGIRMFCDRCGNISCTASNKGAFVSVLSVLTTSSSVSVPQTPSQFDHVVMRLSRSTAVTVSGFSVVLVASIVASSGLIRLSRVSLHVDSVAERIVVACLQSTAAVASIAQAATTGAIDGSATMYCMHCNLTVSNVTRVTVVAGFSLALLLSGFVSNVPFTVNDWSCIADGIRFVNVSTPTGSLVSSLVHSGLESSMRVETTAVVVRGCGEIIVTATSSMAFAASVAALSGSAMLSGVNITVTQSDSVHVASATNFALLLSVLSGFQAAGPVAMSNVMIIANHVVNLSSTVTQSVALIGSVFLNHYGSAVLDNVAVNFSAVPELASVAGEAWSAVLSVITAWVPTQLNCSHCNFKAVNCGTMMSTSSLSFVLSVVSTAPQGASLALFHVSMEASNITTAAARQLGASSTIAPIVAVLSIVVAPISSPILNGTNTSVSCDNVSIVADNVTEWLEAASYGSTAAVMSIMMWTGSAPVAVDGLTIRTVDVNRSSSVTKASTATASSVETASFMSVVISSSEARLVSVVIATVCSTSCSLFRVGGGNGTNSTATAAPSPLPRCSASSSGISAAWSVFISPATVRQRIDVQLSQSFTQSGGSVVVDVASVSGDAYIGSVVLPESALHSTRIVNVFTARDSVFDLTSGCGDVAAFSTVHHPSAPPLLRLLNTSTCSDHLSQCYRQSASVAHHIVLSSVSLRVFSPMGAARLAALSQRPSFEAVVNATNETQLEYQITTLVSQCRLMVTANSRAEVMAVTVMPLLNNATTSSSTALVVRQSTTVQSSELSVVSEQSNVSLATFQVVVEDRSAASAGLLLFAAVTFDTSIVWQNMSVTTISPALTIIASSRLDASLPSAVMNPDTTVTLVVMAVCSSEINATTSTMATNATAAAAVAGFSCIVASLFPSSSIESTISVSIANSVVSVLSGTRHSGTWEGGSSVCLAIAVTVGVVSLTDTSWNNCSTVGWSMGNSSSSSSPVSLPLPPPVPSPQPSSFCVEARRIAISGNYLGLGESRRFFPSGSCSSPPSSPDLCGTFWTVSSSNSLRLTHSPSLGIGAPSATVTGTPSRTVLVTSPATMTPSQSQSHTAEDTVQGSLSLTSLTFTTTLSPTGSLHSHSISIGITASRTLALLLTVSPPHTGTVTVRSPSSTSAASWSQRSWSRSTYYVSPSQSPVSLSVTAVRVYSEDGTENTAANTATPTRVAIASGGAMVASGVSGVVLSALFDGGGGVSTGVFALSLQRVSLMTRSLRCRSTSTATSTAMSASDVFPQTSIVDNPLQLRVGSESSLGEWQRGAIAGNVVFAAAAVLVMAAAELLWRCRRHIATRLFTSHPSDVQSHRDGAEGEAHASLLSQCLDEVHRAPLTTPGVWIVSVVAPLVQPTLVAALQLLAARTSASLVTTPLPSQWTVVDGFLITLGVATVVAVLVSMTWLLWVRAPAHVVFRFRADVWRSNPPPLLADASMLVVVLYNLTQISGSWRPVPGPRGARWLRMFGRLLEPFSERSRCWLLCELVLTVVLSVLSVAGTAAASRGLCTAASGVQWTAAAVCCLWALLHVVRSPSVSVVDRATNVVVSSLVAAATVMSAILNAPGSNASFDDDSIDRMTIAAAVLGTLLPILGAFIPQVVIRRWKRRTHLHPLTHHSQWIDTAEAPGGQKGILLREGRDGGEAVARNQSEPNPPSSLHSEGAWPLRKRVSILHHASFQHARLHLLVKSICAANNNQSRPQNPSLLGGRDAVRI